MITKLVIKLIFIIRNLKTKYLWIIKYKSYEAKILNFLDLWMLLGQYESTVVDFHYTQNKK